MTTKTYRNARGETIPMENVYVTFAFLGGAAGNYAAVLMQAKGWDVATTPELPGDDPSDYERPTSDQDVRIRIGPVANEGLIARCKAIEWSRRLGVPYRES
jgi:hypothetical protein